MEQRNKVNYALLFTILITVGGWALNFGICQNKIEQNTTNIERLEKQHLSDVDRISTRQASTEALLQNINSQLVELNTKMSLLLNGKIISE